LLAAAEQEREYCPQWQAFDYDANAIQSGR
jgi:hypothetical protein